MFFEIFLATAAMILGVFSVWFPSVGTLAITLAIVYTAIIIKGTLENFLGRIATVIHNMKN
jgi:uncharacterized membrane protein